jgi:cell division protein FtsN
MEKHILNLLEEHDRAVIPDLGAFFIRQKDPDIITFNGLLTFNDGMLIDSLMKKEGLSYDDASDRVNRFSRHLTSELEKNKQVTINQIGKISIDKSGEKKFTPWSELDEKAVEKSSSQQVYESSSEEKGEESASRQVYESSSEEKGEESASRQVRESPSEEKGEESASQQVPESSSEEKEEEKSASQQVPESSSEEKEEESVSEEQEKEEEETVTEAAEKSEKPADKDDTGTEKQEPATKEEPSFTLDETLKDVDIDASGDSETQPADEKELLAAEISRDHFTLDESDEDMQKSTSPQVHESASSQVSETEMLRTGEAKFQSRTERSKRRWILPIAIIGSLIIIFIAAWFIFPDPVRNIFITDQSDVEDIVSAEEIETTAGESSPEAFQETEPGQEETGMTETTSSGDEEPPVTEETSKETMITPGEKKYYIVAGCFASRENAENYAEELQNKGYNSQLFGRRKNLYAVSFNSYSTKDQALREMNRIRQSIEPDAWVLFY